MTNGPSLFGENLRGRFGKCRFVASSQTLSPSLNGENLVLRWRCMWVLAISNAAKTSLLIEVSLANRSDKEGMGVCSKVRGMAFGV